MATLQQRTHAPPPRPPPPHFSGVSAMAEASVPVEPTLDLAPRVWSFRDLQKIHDTAYRLVDVGLQADESKDLDVAASSYIESLHLLDNALRVNCEQLSQCTADNVDQAKLMLQKMNKTRQQIAFRLQTIQASTSNASSQQNVLKPSAPPSYEDSVSKPPSLPPSYEEDALTALGESLMRREISNSNLASAEVVFSIEDGVQIFYISAEGYVSAPSYPTSLHIVRFVNDSQVLGPNGEEAPLFLHVGDWVYPLIPDASPAFHTNYGAYLFPDVTASEPEAAVGLIIPDTLSSDDLQKFEDIISSSTLYGEQSAASSPSSERSLTSVEGEEESLFTARRISQGIQTAAEWIVYGIGLGAEKAGGLIKKGSEKYRQRYGPAESVHKIDPKVQKGVIYAREATGGAVKVTGYIVNKLGELTVAIAKAVAPTVSKHGMKILPKSMKKNNSQGRTTVDGVIEVAASGLRGFGTVYMGLETASKNLGRCLADETVQIVTHTYGEEVGTLAENTVYTAGNVIMTAHNANNMGVKALAKRTAKETGKEVLKDYHESRAMEDSSAPSTSTFNLVGKKR